MYKKLKWFSVLTTIGMILVLLGGALVTKTDSGLGCGRSWPLCNGQFIPTNITFELVVELAHRLVSGVVGLMVLILSIWTWKKIGHIREVKFLSVLATIFLIIQALIGAGAVVFGQSDFILAAHFGISLISFAAVFLLTLIIFEADQKIKAKKIFIDKKMKFHIWGITIYSFVVVYSGALVRHVHANLVCPDWPLCVNSISNLFDWNFYQWVQMGHRFSAALFFIWISYITIVAWKQYKQQKVIYFSWIISFVLITLQIGSGALIIFTRLNLTIALLHAFFISCLFGMLSYLCLLSTRSERSLLQVEKLKEENKEIPLTNTALNRMH